MLAQEIIDSLKFTCEVAPEQKDLFTASHVLYRCVIVNPANRLRFTFSYQCNPENTEPSAKDCLYCLFMDASSYDCAIDIDDFLKEFGYTDSPENVRKGKKAYKACKRTAEAIDQLFTTEEKETLDEYFQEY